MAVAKFKAPDTTDVMRAKDGVDNIIREAIGNQPFFYFPTRVGDSPGQLVQLLHTFDQQEYPGWPLLYPLKVPSDKCEKCSQEFCSTINYRRHSPVHHRFKKLDKDTSKTRDLLGAYWDKLSVEEAKEVVSFENVMLEGVPGSSILDTLMTLTQKQGFFLLPPCYLRAGAALLDILESKPSSFPIPSQELFNILDDASEGTFLLGTAASMQKCIFLGGDGKIGLEPKNVVACTSFLLEQILVKAWLADKDAEALRCQKQLVDEEEAAKKRQAEVLKRKREKKIRQKEQKAREQSHKLKVETKGNVDTTVKTLSSAEKSLDTYDVEAQNPEEFANNTPSHDVVAQNPEEFANNTPSHDVVAQNPEEFANNTPSHVPFQHPHVNEEKYGDTQSGHAFGADQIIGQPERELDRLCRAIARWQELPKPPQRTVVSDLHTKKNPPISKPEFVQQYGTRDYQRADTIVNAAGKAWHEKPKPEKDRMVLKTGAKIKADIVKNRDVLIGSIPVNLVKNPEVLIGSIPVNLVKNPEVLIGSIPVNLGKCSKSVGNLVASQEKCLIENVEKLNNSQDKPKKPDFVKTGIDQSTVKLSTPVSQFETKDLFPVQSPEAEVEAVNRSEGFQNLSKLSSDGSDIGFENKISNPEGRVDPGKVQFSSQAAKAFLAQRWGEAISSSHVKLVVSLDKIQDLKVAAFESSDVDSCSNILANEENKSLSTTKASKSKHSGKSKKGTNYKYIPKEKTT